MGQLFLLNGILQYPKGKRSVELIMKDRGAQISFSKAT